MPLINVGDLRTRYELTGTADLPVLVLSNSLGTDFSMWDPQVDMLAQHFRILRYDTRGHGGTSVTSEDCTIEQLGHDVLGLVDKLGFERVHFCGLSLGGAIGIWLGIHAPARLRRLVLCSTAARIGTIETWNTRIATVRREGMTPVAAAVIERWLTPEYRTKQPEKVAQVRRMLEKSSPEGYAACCAAVRDMDQRDAVARIAVPTLVIHGSKDPVTPATDAQFLAGQIRGAVSVELDAAHLANVEQSEAFTEAVSRFCLAAASHLRA